MERKAYSFLTFAALAGVFAFAAPRPPSTRYVPFIETFHRNGRTLIYVLAEHHSPVSFPDAMTDPVFKTIQSVFSKSPPDAVIVEGVDPSAMPGFLGYAKQCAAANYNPPGNACGEPEFSAYSATTIGVPVFTGEPSASAERASFEAHGYSIQDFLAFWIMNNIPPEKRQGQLTEDKFRRLVDRVVRNESHLLGTSVRFTAEEFAAWYAKHMPSPRSYLDIENNDANPYPRPGERKTLWSKLSALNVEERDENIVTTIKTALMSHNRVLIVLWRFALGFRMGRTCQVHGRPKEDKAVLTFHSFGRGR